LFDGVIVMAGAVADGAAIRAAEILGADLAYVGTRFIASAESGASDAYKKMIVEASAADLIFMAGPTAAPASWLRPSLLDNNIAPETPGPDFQQQPGIRPWKTLWSAGQSVELIGDVPTTSAIISRLTAEYDFACSHPRWRDAASTRSPARA
jgi:nitronate monooxygenase